MLSSGGMPSSSMVGIPSPVNMHAGVGAGQGNSMLRPRETVHMMREILAEQEADRVHELPAQPPVKFNNMVVISLLMKLKEEHCSICFSRPLTNQNKNPFFYGSMEVVLVFPLVQRQSRCKLLVLNRMPSTKL
ncbi:hypothetical protein JHK86_050536 [Glycine max]|nr:hypothetical protein JHK86_050536 [Glycine max]